MPNTKTATEVGLSRAMVPRRQRFARERIAGYWIVRDRGKHGCEQSRDRLLAVEAACSKKPARAMHWSIRSVVKVTAMKKDLVHQILREGKLKLH